jgi:hypothetical protein
MKPTLMAQSPTIILSSLQENENTRDLDLKKMKFLKSENLYQKYVNSRIGLFNPE